MLLDVIMSSPLVYIPVSIVLAEFTAYEIEKEIEKNKEKIADVLKRFLD